MTMEEAINEIPSDIRLEDLEYFKRKFSLAVHKGKPIASLLKLKRQIELLEACLRDRKCFS